MSKIIGNTVGMGLPKPNLMQDDPRKGDYVKGKSEFILAVQADFAQNDPEQSNYVRNRTHWEEDKRNVIEWDGDTTDRRTYSSEGKTYYKISNIIPAEEDIIGSIITLSDERAATVEVTESNFAGFDANRVAHIGNHLLIIDMPPDPGVIAN